MTTSGTALVLLVGQRMATPGIAAPLGSVTTPLISPKVSGLEGEATNASRTTKTLASNRGRSMDPGTWGAPFQTELRLSRLQSVEVLPGGLPLCHGRAGRIMAGIDVPGTRASRSVRTAGAI